MLRVFAVVAALFAAGSSPVVSQSQPGWTYAVVGEGGFGWSNPTAGDHPIVIETILRLVPPRQVDGATVRWTQYTVRLDCNAQTATILSGRASTEEGVRVRDFEAQPPIPIGEEGEVPAAGKVICNEAPFREARTASSLNEVTRAMGGASTSLLRPLLGGVPERHSAAALAAPQQSRFTTEAGIDLYGSDIRMVEVGPGDVAACSARCDADSGCRAFTLYTPPPGDKGFCWLKHTVGERRPGQHAVSGLRRASPATPSPTAALVAPPTLWEAAYMDPLEPLYVLAPDAPNAAFYRSLPRSDGRGRHEMWIVAALRGVSPPEGGAYDLGASLYSIDCNARTTQVLRGRVYRDMVPVRDTPIEPIVPLQQGTVTHQMIIQACDNPPLPAFAGSLSQVRRAVPLATAAAISAPAPPPRPVAPPPASAAADCATSNTGCEYGIVAHMPGASGQVGHQWVSSGPWQNRIRLFSRSWGQFNRPVRVCGRSLYAGPDQLNKTVEGWLNPRREALATRFSLNDSRSDAAICSWAPGGRGGSLE